MCSLGSVLQPTDFALFFVLYVSVRIQLQKTELFLTILSKKGVSNENLMLIKISEKIGKMGSRQEDFQR